MAVPPLIIQGILFLSLGNPQSLPAKSPQIWFSKPDVVRAEVLSSQLLLKGEREGLVFASGLSTHLQKIVVLSPASFRALQACGTQDLDFSSDLPQIKEERLSEATLARLHGCGFEALALGRAGQKRLEGQLLEREASLAKRGLHLSRIGWNERGQRDIVVATADKSPDLLRLREILSDYGVVYRISTVNRPQPGRTLSFETTLFEFSRTKARSLGLRFPESIKLWPLEAGALADAQGAALSLGLDFGEKEGVGKVLARPKIRTQPGQKAIFQSGGEIPVKNQNLHSSQTQWKPYGLQIEIEPDANLETGSPEVSLSFKIEVSEPDFGRAIDGVPSLSLRKLQNRFDLRTDELTVLTSLIQLRKSRNQKGLAGIREVPLFGGLFDNHNDQDSESELYFALRPSWEEI